jgi:hypothetical protein
MPSSSGAFCPSPAASRPWGATWSKPCCSRSRT